MTNESTDAKARWSTYPAEVILWAVVVSAVMLIVIITAIVWYFTSTLAREVSKVDKSLTKLESKMAELDPGILAGVANANFKTIAEAAAVGLAQAQGIAAQNLASHQQRLNLLAESSLAQSLNRMNALDPEEAASISKVEKSDIAKVLSELGSQIAGIQQMMKGAQTTLPQTGTGG